MTETPTAKFRTILQPPGNPAPPRGKIWVRAKLVTRRAGIVRQRKLNCIHNHRIRLGSDRVFDGVKVCGSNMGAGVLCEAQVYLQQLRSGAFWVVDVTAAEAEMIDRDRLTIADIAERFCLPFPGESAA